MSFFRSLKDFLGTGVGMAEGVAKGAGQIVGGPIEYGRAAVGALTHNPAAEHAATNRFNQDYTTTVGAFQYPFRSAVKLGASASHALLNTPDTVSPPNTPFFHALLGTEPIQGIEDTYNQVKGDTGSTAKALGTTFFNTIGEVFALDAAKSGAEKLTKGAAEGYKGSPILNSQAGSASFHEPLTEGEKSMGKALGMSEEQITKAKTTSNLPPTETAAPTIDEPGKIMARSKTEVVPTPLEPGSALNRTKGFPEATKNAFADLVNGRSAADIQGAVAAEPFRALDTEGTGAFGKIQAGDTSGLFGQVRNYFEGKFKQLQDAGLQLTHQKDYLPQIWENTPEEISKVYGKSLSTSPSFTQSKLIEDYQHGIDAGLTPKFETVGDLVGWYESTANKALANKAFIDRMVEQKHLIPAEKAPKEWGLVDHNLLPTDTTYKVDPTLAKPLKNYLEGAKVEELGSAAKFITSAKNAVLGFGIPKTGINSYGLTRLASYVLSSNNPVGAFFRGAGWILNPKAAGEYVSANLDRAAFFVNKGLKLSVEDEPFTRTVKPVEGGIIAKTFSKARDIQNSLFEDPTFRKVLPAYKISYAEGLFKDLVNKKLSEDAAGRIAAKSTNTLFGGFNLQELGRSQDLQNVFRSIALAPDMIESGARTGGGIIKGAVHLTDPQYRAYRIFARNLAAAYVTANITNKAMSGHWMYQNQRGNEFNIETGKTDSNGKSIAIKPFGSAVDFIRLPVQIAADIASGNAQDVAGIVRSRLSLPLGLGVSLVTNTNSFGQPLVGKDQYGQPISGGKTAANLTNAALQSAAPEPAQQAFSLAQGKSSPLEATTRSLELPVSFRSTKTATRSRKAPSGRVRKGRRVRVARTARAPRARIARTTKVKSSRVRFAKTLTKVRA